MNFIAIRDFPKIILKLIWNGMGWCGLDSSRSGLEPVSVFYECDNKPSSFLKCVEFPKWLRKHQLVFTSYGKCKKHLALEQLHSNFSFITLATNNGMDRNFGEEMREHERSDLYTGPLTYLCPPFHERKTIHTHTHTYTHTHTHTHIFISKIQLHEMFA